MLKLSLPKEPYWIDLPGGARVRVKPLIMAIYHASRSRAWIAAEKAVGATRGSDGKLSEATDYPLLNGYFNGYFAQSLARYGIEAWDGIGDEAGAPLDCTPDRAAELMLIPQAGAVFLTEYTSSLTAVIAEGNA